MIRAAALAVAVLLCGGGVSPSFAQDERPAAKDTAKIEACLTDPAMKAKLAATSRQMQAQNGPAKAAGLLVGLLGS